MKRTGFKRPSYTPTPAAPLQPVAEHLRRQVSMPRADSMLPPVVRQSPFRSEAWRRAVAGLPCIKCGKAAPSQAAHPNHREKGMGTKAPDCWCFPLCLECHREFDQGGTYTKQERHDLADTWTLKTIHRLAKEGLIRP